MAPSRDPPAQLPGLRQPLPCLRQPRPHVLRFNGHLYPGIPMPHRLVGWLPPIKPLRNSDRFNIVLSLPLALPSGQDQLHLKEETQIP
jgi:hypothetical protein